MLKPINLFSSMRIAARSLMVVVALGFFSGEAFAGKVTPKAFRNSNLFGISVAGANPVSFYGKADLVLSVSMQEYTTGPLFVTEVVIDMQGSNQLLRLYTSRPVGLQDAANAARSASDATSDATDGVVQPPPLPSTPAEVEKADRAAQRIYAGTAGAIVVKTYPVTTHAKTVEFAVGRREELVAFYDAFRSLYCGEDLLVANGRVINANSPASGNAARSGAAAANANAASLANATVVTRLGGVLFTIE